MSNCSAEALKVLEEMRDRLVRLESRTVQLGDYVGANLRAKQKITIRRLALGRIAVDIDALDVSLSRINKELESAGVEGGTVEIYLDHLPIGTFDFEPKEKTHG